MYTGARRDFSFFIGVIGNANTVKESALTLLKVFLNFRFSLMNHSGWNTSKSPEITDSARVAHIPDILATLPAAFGPPLRF